MKKTLIFFLLILLNNQIYSQVAIEYGEIFKNDKREIPTDIIGKDDTGYYFLYTEGKYGQGDDIFLRKFDTNLTPTKLRVNLKIEMENTKFNSLGVTKIKNKLIHIFSLKTEAEKGYYYQFIDLQDFSKTQKKLITTIDYLSKPNSKEFLTNFYVTKQEDSIILFFKISEKNEATLKLKKQIFDIDFNKKSEVIYELPFISKTLSHYEVFRGVKEDYYLKSKVYDDGKIFANENNQKYEHQLYSLSSEKPRLITSIRPKGVHMRYLDINIDNENEIVLTSLTSKKGIYSTSGIYTSKLNLETGNFIYEKYNRLSADFFTQLMVEGKKKEKFKRKYNEGKKENSNYVFKNSLLLENGETLVLAEQIWSMASNFVTTFYHHNIAVIKLDKEGNIVWETKIGKKHTKTNTSIYNSFLPVIKDNKLLLFYNGNPGNQNHITGNVLNSFGMGSKKAFLCTEVDIEDGKYKRHIISNEDELQGITIRPFLYNWIDNSTLLMFGQDISNLKNQRFFTLKL